jgi:hypothetical protein
MLPAVAGLICTPHAVIPATARAKKSEDRLIKTTIDKRHFKMNKNKIQCL